jgi:hypothetical protein
MEFPSHADARAAQELLAEQFSEEIFLRPKHQHPSDGNVASWRMSLILREELGNRTFGQEEIDAILLAHNYNGTTNTSWLYAATKHGVIARLRRGEYRFLQPRASSPTISDALCTTCQPEPLQCLVS